MILAQHNILKFFTDKRARIWDKNINSRKSKLVFYPSTDISGFGNTPAFSLNVDNYTTASADLYDSNDNWITGLGYLSAVDKTTYQQLYVLSQDATLTKGYYYVLLTIDDVLYYSDVFGVVVDLTEFLKINVASSNITVGGLPLKISTLVTEFYLNAEYHDTEGKIDQQGDLENGITRVDFGTSILIREFEIYSNESIYGYMRALAMLKVNGIITVTWEYESFIASEILVEKSTNHYNGISQTKFTFVDERDSVQPLN